MPAKLTLFPTQGTSRYFIFREGRNHFLGREPSSDLQVDDPRVSARHALFQWTGNDWILVDLRSKNGTVVNGARITEVPLQDEDWLSFGGLLARFERVSDQQVERLLSERADRLQTFIETRRDLDSDLDPQELLRRLIQSVLDLTGAERGFVVLVKPTGELEAEVAAGFPAFEPLDERFGGSFGAIEKVLKSGVSVVTSNAKADAFLGKRRSVIELGIGALACVPLKADSQVIGLIYVDGRKSGGVFTELDLEILEALADHTALVVGSLRLGHQIRELVGAPRLTVPAGSRNFLDELATKVSDIARSPVRRTDTST